jgi:hypothetical protein
MKNAEATDALFRLRDMKTQEELEILEVEPTPYTGGPWNPAHQHGGAVSGLMAFAIDRMPSPVPMRIARISLDMFRGVPLTPLRVETRIRRSGRRIQSLEAELYSEDVLVSRASALRIRHDDTLGELDAPSPPDPDLGSPPDVVPPFEMRSGLEIPGFVHACDLVPGRATTCGEVATSWARLRCAVVEGFETSATVGLAAIADFASGTGNAMDYERFTSVNADLSVHIVRAPRSDWLAIRGVTSRAPDGIGQSHAVIHDEEGAVARASASLLLDQR